MTLYAVSTIQSDNDKTVNTDTVYNYYMQHPDAKDSFKLEKCETIYYAYDKDTEGTKDYKSCTCKLILHEAILQYKDVTYASPGMPILINFTKADIVDKDNNKKFTIDGTQATTTIAIANQNDTATLFTTEYRLPDAYNITSGGGVGGPTITPHPFNKIPFFTRDGAKQYKVNNAAYTFVKNSAENPAVSTCPSEYMQNDGIALATTRAKRLRHAVATKTALQFCNFTTSIENNDQDVEVANAELNIHMSLTTAPATMTTVLSAAINALPAANRWNYQPYDPSSTTNKGNVFALQAWHTNIPTSTIYKYTR